MSTITTTKKNTTMKNIKYRSTDGDLFTLNQQPYGGVWFLREEKDPLNVVDLDSEFNYCELQDVEEYLTEDLGFEIVECDSNIITTSHLKSKKVKQSKEIAIEDIEIIIPEDEIILPLTTLE